LAARGVTIGRAGIAKIEAGSRAVTDFELVALAHALSVPLIWLLDGKEKCESSRPDC
jgi:transcriptional regulator with XRE-family HTH domain